MTFTTRTLIWEEVIYSILEKPLLGYGYYEKSKMILPNLVASNAHNFFLQLFYIGGAITVFTFLVSLYMAGKKIYQSRDKNISTTLAVVILIFFVISFVESFRMFDIYIYLLIGYHLNYIYRTQKNYDTFECDAMFNADTPNG